LEQADHEGSRHVHEVGRLLGGEFGVCRHQGHRLARGHVGQNPDQEVNGCAGHGDRLTVFLDLQPHRLVDVAVSRQCLADSS